MSPDDPSEAGWAAADLAARWWLAMLEAAAKAHPDLVQEAVWRVFDLQSARQQLDEIRAKQMEVFKLGQDAREMIQAISRDFAHVEALLERIGDHHPGK